MARIDIQGGLERDEFYDKNGNLLGVAEYDLNDAVVRLRVLELVDSIEPRWKKFFEKTEPMESVTERTRCEVQFVEDLISSVDDAFGVDFCAKALGPRCRNIITLLEVLEGIAVKYGAQPNIQIDRMVNATKNREQRRLASKRK